MFKAPKLTGSSLKWALFDLATVGIALGNFMAYKFIFDSIPLRPSYERTQSDEEQSRKTADLTMPQIRELMKKSED